MSRSHGTEKTDARRLVEASAWRTHLAEHDRETTPAFEAWLTAHDGNRQAWDRVRQAWDLFGDQAASPELLDLRRRALGQVRAAGRRRWRAWPSFDRHGGFVIAAGLALLAVSGFVAFDLMGPDTYRTEAGERRLITLPDGSELQLDSLTELRVHYSGRARDLSLLQGQARFDVAHDV
jgi:transmembrane sensor